MNYRVGIDLGGTNIASAVVGEGFRIMGRGKVKTAVPRPAQELVADIAASVRMALAEAGLSMEEVEEIGMGLPGTVDPVSGVLEYATNLYIKNLPIRDMLQRELQKPVSVGNDASAAAAGEFLAGAARGYRSAVIMTLGTGIGGGVIMDGKIYDGFNYGAGEIGHMGIVVDGRLCNCGRRGCLETYCSAPGLIRSTEEAMEEHPESALHEFARRRGKVSARTAFEAMRAGDEAAARVVEEYIRYLSYGVANIINLYAPEAVVVGGGVSHEGEALLEPLRRLTAEQVYVKNPQRQTRILPAMLGNDAGIIGAAFLKEASDAREKGAPCRV